MFSFAPTRNYALVRSILTHPKIWPYLADDFTGSPESFEPKEDPLIAYVLVLDDASDVLGCFTFVVENMICWDVHVALLPKAWGRRSRVIAKELADWIWTKSKCERLIAKIAVSNRAAIAFAVAAGLEAFGVDCRSVKHAGQLEDRVYLGMSRPQ